MLTLSWMEATTSLVHEAPATPAEVPLIPPASIPPPASPKPPIREGAPALELPAPTPAWHLLARTSHAMSEYRQKCVDTVQSGARHACVSRVRLLVFVAAVAECFPLSAAVLGND